MFWWVWGGVCNLQFAMVPALPYCLITRCFTLFITCDCWALAPWEPAFCTWAGWGAAC